MDTANFVRSRVGGGLVELSHRQLGHLNGRNVCALQSMARDMNLDKTSRPTKDKQYVIKLDNDAKRQAKKPSEIVHSSVCDP